MRIIQIDHVQLAMPEGQEALARAFFGDLLALDEIAKPPALMARGGVWYQIHGDRQLHLGVERDFQPARKAHPCFVVEQLDELAKTLSSAGYSVVWDDALLPVRRFYSEDCFENRLEFLDRPTPPQVQELDVTSGCENWTQDQT